MEKVLADGLDGARNEKRERRPNIPWHGHMQIRSHFTLLFMPLHSPTTLLVSSIIRDFGPRRLGLCLSQASGSL